MWKEKAEFGKARVQVTRCLYITCKPKLDKNKTFGLQLTTIVLCRLGSHHMQLNAVIQFLARWRRDSVPLS